MNEILWQIKVESVKKLIDSGKRIDDRKFDEFREIHVEKAPVVKAEGSSLVKLGNTTVLVGVKMDVGEPFPDTPEEGVLITSAELVPLASPSFEPGPPDENSIELARVVDRVIRESKMIDMNQLVIEPGEKVWMVFVDIHVLDYDGNLFDASTLGAVSALSCARIPRYEDGKVIYEEKTKELPLRDLPVSLTFAKINDKIVLDPNLAEEKAMSARLTVGITQENNVCALQKGGSGYLTYDEVCNILDMAAEKSKELREVI